MNIFQQKLSKIPPEVAKYLVSMESAKLNCLVGEKYGLKEERFDKLVDLVCSLFFKEIKLVDLIKTSKELFGFDDVKAKAFSLDIAGIRVLVVKDWLEDVEAYIKSLGGKIEDYASYADQQKKALVEEERFFKEQLSEEIVDSVADTDKKESFEDANTPLQFDVSKEKADSVKNFKEYIAELLKAENFDIAKEYNDILLEILLDGGNSAKDDLEKALYANQEKITTANFILDGKVSVGTVANWIKHFLALKGSDMFDNIVVSSFLVQSPNAKILNSDEKAIVRRLLLLYRNLKFFPQSMPNQTGEGWEIIPTETEEDAPRTKIVPKKEVVTPDAKLAELEDRLSKALAGSLQRRVIEEEIKKIKNKK